MSHPVVSAIICTHNRAAYLGAAIDSLLLQTFQDYEILVVDNGSTDVTREIVESRSHPRLRYLYEPVLGLSVARNRGAAAARGAILAYLDDDAEASPDWLAALYGAFAADEQVAIAGGKVTLLWPPQTPPPRWLSSGLAGNLGAYDLGASPRLITQPGLTPRGLNYAVRQSFLKQVGGFDPQLGRVGKNLLSNEELHLTQQALQRGFKVLYLPQALVAHNVAPERLIPQWFLRRSWWQGISECYREQLQGTLTWHQLRSRSLCLLRGLRKAFWHWRDQATCFDNLVYAYGQLGYLLSSVRVLLQPPKSTPAAPESNSSAS